MVQSPADRLLTEAAGAAAYRTAGQVDTQADARIAAMLTTQKGQASGIASLGTDGKVPTAQLPPTAAPTIYSVVRTAVTLGNVATPVDVGLSASLTAGVWLVDAMLSTNLSSGNGNLAFRLFPDNTGVQDTRIAYHAAMSSAYPIVGNMSSASQIATIGAYSWVQLRGVVVLTAAKVANLNVSNPGGPGSGIYLYAGAQLIMTKVG